MNVRAALLGLALIVPLAALPASGLPVPPFVPRVLEGYAIAPLAAGPAITAITFGPGGPDLYATTLTGSVLRYPLTWTDAGPVAGAPVTFANGFSQPLGLVFHGEALFVADSASGAESGRLDGRVTRIADGEARIVVDGLPNGRHNTNNLRAGPDGRIYVANGNPNDNGIDGGEADVFPYSGAILSIDPEEVGASPAILHWRDDAGARIHPDDIAGHPRNVDFAQKVRVLAYGFRNVYDVAFSPTGVAYTGMNGADEPSSQDALFKIEPGADFGYPFCFNEGAPGAVGADVAVVPNPVYGDAARCAGVPPATALLGWHTCATGLDVPPAGSPFGNAAYVAECGPFFPERDQVPSTHDTGHKVRQVLLDEAGDAVEVRDFVTGLQLPTDAHFGPDGALYIADADAVYRVSALPLARTQAAAPVPGTPVVALPGAWTTNYANPIAVVAEGARLDHVNLDLMRHNVVASDASRPADRPWCAFYAGACPLFWSATVGTGAVTPVVGLEDAEPLRPYEFYCTLHHNMVGQLIVLPAAAGAQGGNP